MRLELPQRLVKVENQATRQISHKALYILEHPQVMNLRTGEWILKKDLRTGEWLLKIDFFFQSVLESHGLDALGMCPWRLIWLDIGSLCGKCESCVATFWKPV
ncbi:hypothetical protein KC19_VG006800 [Ceratodon purpureus]|uniref:Uncharacterized protein n=1 Tax=Ceratodon purpureus TaxID=3225 RepID=A0A8T0HKN6_CERPU|nr:hypothetical protein KC19_11G040900 [Ceratodon purpureus]KAG0571376.1 hypothetical protein KC19_VG006800 [Ceratodon purpureus]